MPKSFNVKKYLRMDKMPHIWCPGCGNGMVMSAFLRAVDTLKLDPDKIVVVSGIGCSSRITGYIDFNTLHTTHGRPLAFATGIKLANPSLEVVVIAGDGDTTAIGGNHFLHACRRNVNITLIVINNSIYGMTGGQYSPLTPQGDKATTAPYGNIEPQLDVCRVAETAGASFVARGGTYQPVLLEDLVLRALENKGFSFLEVLSQCPVYYGRLNKKGDAVEMLKLQKESTVSVKAASKLAPAALKGKTITGVLSAQYRPEYTEEYEKIKKASKVNEQ
jgi:2-oxoglutarate/2-oxoacid ferredoxin oxidoreductase subunit beta